MYVGNLLSFFFQSATPAADDSGWQLFCFLKNELDSMEVIPANSVEIRHL